MKRVVWVYRNYQVAPERYRNKVAGNCEIFSDREFRTFSGCLATWQLLAPELTRTLYVDQSVYDFLKEKGILYRFDEVTIVDFEKKLDSYYPGIDFFAAPKLWALTQQKEPFFLVDTELMLLKPTKEWLEEDSYVAVHYELQNPIVPKNWDTDDFKKYETLLKLLPEEKRNLQPASMINAGLTSWPDPLIARWVGWRALQICQKVCETELDWRYKWTFCEESILVPLIEFLSKKSVQILPNISETSDLGFTEWSSPETVPHVYGDFKFWASHHPNIPVEDLRKVDLYAEY